MDFGAESSDDEVEKKETSGNEEDLPDLEPVK
jgi:hypothetical protein